MWQCRKKREEAVSICTPLLLLADLYPVIVRKCPSKKQKGNKKGKKNHTSTYAKNERARGLI